MVILLMWNLGFAPQARREAAHEKANALHGGGRRLSFRAVKGAWLWRSLERSGSP